MILKTKQRLILINPRYIKKKTKYMLFDIQKELLQRISEFLGFKQNFEIEKKL